MSINRMICSKNANELAEKHGSFLGAVACPNCRQSQVWAQATWRTMEDTQVQPTPTSIFSTRKEKGQFSGSLFRTRISCWRRTEFMWCSNFPWALTQRWWRHCASQITEGYLLGSSLRLQERRKESEFWFNGRKSRIKGREDEHSVTNRSSAKSLHVALKNFGLSESLGSLPPIPSFSFFISLLLFCSNKDQTQCLPWGRHPFCHWTTSPVSKTWIFKFMKGFRRMSWMINKIHEGPPWGLMQHKRYILGHIWFVGRDKGLNHQGLRRLFPRLGEAGLWKRECVRILFENTSWDGAQTLCEKLETKTKGSLYKLNK